MGYEHIVINELQTYNNVINDYEHKLIKEWTIIININ